MLKVYFVIKTTKLLVLTGIWMILVLFLILKKKYNSAEYTEHGGRLVVSLLLLQQVGQRRHVSISSVSVLSFTFSYMPTVD